MDYKKACDIRGQQISAPYNKLGFNNLFAQMARSQTESFCMNLYQCWFLEKLGNEAAPNPQLPRGLA